MLGKDLKMKFKKQEPKNILMFTLKQQTFFSLMCSSSQKNNVMTKSS